MLISRAYRTRIYPTEMQAEHLRQWANGLRGIWNYTVTQSYEDWRKVNQYPWAGSDFIECKRHKPREDEVMFALPQGSTGRGTVRCTPRIQNQVEAEAEQPKKGKGRKGRRGRKGKKKPSAPKKKDTTVGAPQLCMLQPPRIKVPGIPLYARSNSGPEWMTQIPSTYRSRKGRSMQKALDAFFNNKANRPAYQKRTGRLSLAGQNVKFTDNCHIRLPALLSWDRETKEAFKRPIRLAEPIERRLIAGSPGDFHWGVSNVATITYEGGKWFASFPLEKHHPPAPRDEQLARRGKKKINVIGVDANCAAYVCSDDTRYNVPESLRRAQIGVIEAQRALSLCSAGSKRYARARERLNRRSAKQARIRRDWIDKITYDLVTRADVVVIEDLNVKKMTRSKKGTKASPGKAVKSQARLNRSILNAAFGLFRTKLLYKAQWYGKKIAVVDPAYTSQDCSQCRDNRMKIGLGVRVFHCSKCGVEIDRDLNAAINIRDKFLALRELPGAFGLMDAPSPSNGVQGSSGSLTSAKILSDVKGKPEKEDTHGWHAE